MRFSLLTFSAPLTIGKLSEAALRSCKAAYDPAYGADHAVNGNGGNQRE
jgi:hypothetical protein